MLDTVQLRALYGALLTDDASPCLLVDGEWSIYAWNPAAVVALSLSEAGLAGGSPAPLRLDPQGIAEGGPPLPGSPALVCLAGRQFSAAVRMVPWLGEAWPKLYSLRLTQAEGGQTGCPPEDDLLPDPAAELERANRELEEFSCSVSHELRTPLRFMNRIAHLVLREHAEKLPYDAVQRVEMIIECTRQMSGLVDDLLAFSRVSRQTAEFRTIDMRVLARQVVEDLTRDLGEREVRIEVGALPRAVGDRDLLRQVLANLVGNALKFTRPRARTIIEVGGQIEGGEAKYFVRDNGIGFDPARAANLFGVFHRLHSSDAFEGAGVGLALVKRIVERHGGRAWAEGAPDAGATFWFALRRPKSTRGEPAEAGDGTPAPTPVASLEAD